MGVYGQTLNIADRFFRETDDDSLILEQAVIMVLNTARGTYFTDPEYGLLLSDYINSGLTSETIVLLPYDIQAALEHDERIASALVTISIFESTSQGVKLSFGIVVTPADGAAITLNLDVDKLGLSVITRGQA